MNLFVGKNTKNIYFDYTKITNLFLSYARAGEYTVRITDNLGREIARWAGIHAIGDENIIWNSDVPSGVYYCVFSAGGVVKSVPIVVVK